MNLIRKAILTSLVGDNSSVFEEIQFLGNNASKIATDPSPVSETLNVDQVLVQDLPAITSDLTNQFSMGDSAGAYIT